MYYVPDGTKECGYYECKKCGNRFLSMQTMKRIPCPDCEAEIDYEIGPDESLEDVLDTFLQAITTRKVKNLPQYMKSLLWTSFATYKLNTISGITAPYKEVKNVYGLH